MARPQGEARRWAPALWVTPDERAAIVAAAAAAGVPVARYLVEVALGRIASGGAPSEGDSIAMAYSGGGQGVGNARATGTVRGGGSGGGGGR
jgi:hypothetical protein